MDFSWPFGEFARLFAMGPSNGKVEVSKIVKCDCCGAPATVYLLRVSNGSTVRVNLCAGCARKKGILDESGAPTAALLRGESPGKIPEQGNVFQATCDYCGFPGSQLVEKKILGCPRCYATFAELLEPVLKRLHRSANHSGKAPMSQLVAVTLSPMAENPKAIPEGNGQGSVSKDDLEIQLRLAITEERYEEAAALRDRLRKKIRRPLRERVH